MIYSMSNVLPGQPSQLKRRRKRRVAGSENPPKVSFIVRLEKPLFDELTLWFDPKEQKRNEWISETIAHALTQLARARKLISKK